MRGFRVNPFEKYLTKEDRLQRAVCQYVLTKYKTRVIPMNTEGNKSAFEQFKFKQTGGFRGILDLFIPISRGGYHGLFIELKAEGVTVFKKNGDVRASANDRLKIQNEQRLKHLLDGYSALFAIGFDESKRVIDWYFSLES